MQSAVASPEADALADQFATQGVAIVEYALSAGDLAYIEATFPNLGMRTPGARDDAFSWEARGWYGSHAGLARLANRLLRAEARLSRLQAFDKSPDANWFVPWHQDRAEPGQERDTEALMQMVTLRIHLDDCDGSNGPLDVLPGTHTLGRLDARAITALVATTPSRLCLVARGDIVAMRPLLLHRSQRALRPAARRVVHIEFTSRM